MNREAIEKLLSELGFSGKGLDLAADAVELHKEGMSMMELYRLMGRTRSLGTCTVSNKLHGAISRAWERKTGAMEQLFDVYLLCRPPRNREFLVQVERHLKEKAPASAATDPSAKKKDESYPYHNTGKAKGEDAR